WRGDRRSGEADRPPEAGPPPDQVTALRPLPASSVPLQPLLDPLASLLGLAPAALRTGLRHWAAAAALLVTGLALRGTWEDPARPYAPALATLAASALLGAVALGFRLPRYVYSSGLLINVAAGMAWVGWGEASAAGFVLAQVLAFAGASALWSVIE